MRTTMSNVVLLLTAGFALVTPALAQDVGIPSCDGFLKTYQSCVVAKMPGEQKSTAAAALEKTRANWLAVSATAEGKTQLDATCKDTVEKMKKEVAALNCAW